MTPTEIQALPAAVTLPTAARALGIGRTMAYRLAAAGTFPVPVAQYRGRDGRMRYGVTRADIIDKESNLDHPGANRCQ